METSAKLVSKMEARTVRHPFLLLAFAIVFSVQVSCQSTDRPTDFYNGCDEDDVDCDTMPGSWFRPYNESGHKYTDRRVFGGKVARLGDFPSLVFVNVSYDCRENPNPPKPKKNGTSEILKRKRDTKAITKAITKLIKYYKIVHETSNCTGTILSPKWVLTAAHCLGTPFIYTYCYRKQDGRLVNFILTEFGCKTRYDAM